MNDHIIVVGSSHLAFRTGLKLRAKGIVPVQISSDQLVEGTLEKSDLEHVKELLARNGGAQARAICLLDDSDSMNIKLLMAALALNEKTPVFVAIANENLIEHIASSHPSVHAFNPNAIAAATFADAVHSASHVHPKDTPKPIFGRYISNIRTDRIIQKLLILFGCVLLAGTLFFKWSEGYTWSFSLYLASTLISSLGFEDAILRNYTTPVLIARIVLMLSIQVFALISFSLIVDRVMKRRSEVVEFGRKRYTLSDHIVVCGLGRTGFHVATELLRRGEKVVVIEPDDENRFLDAVRSAGAKVLIGDASLAKNLLDAGIERAAGLISVISSDLKNLEIGLNARSLRKDIRLILRIFDKEIAEEMKTRFNIHFAFSTSSLAAKHLVSLMTK